MLFFIIIGGILVFAVAVVGSLFYMLKKESEDTSKLINELKQAPKLSTSSLDPKTNPFLDVPVMTNPLEAPEVLQMSREFAEKEAAFQNKVERLELELKDISNKAQSQSQEALDTIEKLRKENEELKAFQPVPSAGLNDFSGVQQTVGQLNEEQAGLQSRLVESQQRALELQEEVTALKHQMTREIDEARVQTAQLKEDNERLMSSLEAVASEATRGLQDEMAALKQENEQLRKVNEEAAALNQLLQQSSSTAASVDTLAFQDEIDELKRQIQALKLTNNDLLLANQGLKLSAESAISEATASQQDQIDALTRENQELKSTMAVSAVPVVAENPQRTDEGLSNELSLAQQRVKELNEQNEHLNERLEALQWDLTKTKAQMTGFERACANYEIQLKEALEKKGS